MQVGEGDGAGLDGPGLGLLPVGAGVTGAGASLERVAETGAEDAPDAEPPGLGLRPALDGPVGLGAAEVGATDIEGITTTGCSSAPGVLAGRAAGPPSCGAASATTPAPPITRPAAVIRTIRRPRPVRRLARPAARGALAGSACGSGTAALAAAPQPGQE
ncbi:hypothetical protein [Kitasatospora sp. NPDC088346]|uniref:hypothetical protein n=1 Tax=Kitasatospora sp. NPDC088346 TaxID=3364073 RepID=UPI0037FFC922